MSNWSANSSGGSSTALRGSEGELISIRISVQPRMLEYLLEALAQVSFPINPQIYHQASIVYVFPDGHKESHPTTMVEFPAYIGRLDDVARVLKRNGFSPDTLHVTSMLSDIQSGPDEEPAPAGAPYKTLILHRQTAAN